MGAGQAHDGPVFEYLLAHLKAGRVSGGAQLNYHLRHRPNLRTAGGAEGAPWHFTSSRPGRHIDPQAIMQRLRALGINLQEARNTALQALVAEIPAPLVAEMLCYSYQDAQRHAEETGKHVGELHEVTPVNDGHYVTHPETTNSPNAVPPMLTATRIEVEIMRR